MDAVKLNPQDAAAIRAVKLMDVLFAIDREAREAQMDHAARHRLRQEKAPPLLDQIHEHIQATSKTVLPESALGRACSHTLGLWTKLTRFLEYPQLELSNNLTENSMRPVAVDGRTGSISGARRLGRVLPLSCRWLKAAAGSRSRCGTTWPMSYLALPTLPSSASPRSRQQHGPPGKLLTIFNSLILLPDRRQPCGWPDAHDWFRRTRKCRADAASEPQD